MLDLPKTTVHVALSTLVDERLVAERRVGRTGVYGVDLTDPLVRTLKIARAIRRVQDVTDGIREDLELALLFGSASRGENRRASDIDLLLVTRRTDSVTAALAQHQWLQPVVMTSEAHMQLLAENGTFAKELARGITIWERR